MPRYDWAAIRRYYDAGHTLKEAQVTFGFSNGAWDRAVARGDVIPRPGRPRGANGATRARVVELAQQGLTKAEIARELGIAKSSVSRHCARAGLARDERAARRYDWARVQEFYDAGHTIRECAERFGFAPCTFNEARRRGDLVTRPRGAPLDLVFTNGAVRDRGHLKARMRQANVLPDACEGCGIREWAGQPIVLQLHHRNGDPRDHRLENLALLCPNCHSQTPNWAGRNARRHAA